MEFIKTNLFTIASDIRYFLLTGLETLPLTIGGTFLLIGHFVGNYAMLFFLIGYLGLVPVATFLVNLLSDFFADPNKHIPGGGKDSKVCNIISSNTTERADNIVSYWMTMTGFFFGYIFTNAYALYSMAPTQTPDPSNPESGKQIDAGIALRSSQSITAMVLIVALGIIVLYMRIFYNGCDFSLSGNPFVLILSLLAVVGSVAGGWAWYEVLGSVGDNRLADLFGIANRMMTPSALINAPYACLPTA
jgi:hypothetical protein